jgi:hypothetical protein
MIVKVPRNRHDGRSSFGDLKKYITEGIGQAGRDIDTGSWDRLTQYITKPSVLNALGDHVEKTIGVEIGNVECLKTAAAEMRAVASQNLRAKNPVYHYILSWPEGEKPLAEQIFDAARDTLIALGMHDHQYIIAIHANTDNIHAHIEVNRVHPVTFKAARLEWAHKTLHKAAREIEIARGWRHDNGIYQVVFINGQKQVVHNADFIDSDQVRTQGGANRFETWSGEQSLESWSHGEPSKALRQLLADPKATSWQDLHRVLGQYGLQLRATGGGGMRVHDIGDATARKDDTGLAVSASKAFRFLKRKELEARWGAFEECKPELATLQPERTYQRDPDKRLDRRLERKALRDWLRQRFLKEQADARHRYDIAKRAIADEFAGYDINRRTAIDRQYRVQRASIKTDPALSSAQKQQAYMLLKLTMLKAHQQLREQIARERLERRMLLPTLPVWREWVEQQTQLGDDAAMSALRGMIYQDQRNAKKAIAVELDEPVENTIRPALPAHTDPFVRKIGTLTWQIARNGNVTYRLKDGNVGFIDAGDKLVFGRAAVSDEALALTLQYARDKWNGMLHINGGDAAFLARVTRMAADLKIELSNPELQPSMRPAKTSPVKSALPPLPDDSIPARMPINQKSAEALLLERFPQAQITRATNHDKRYVGPIVAQDSRFLVQHLGRDQYALHEKAAFPEPLPISGQSVAIAYQSGRAIAKTRTALTR